MNKIDTFGKSDKALQESPHVSKTISFIKGSVVIVITSSRATFYIRLCPNTKQNKKHHLSKTKIITAKTAGFMKDAKIKMKFLENTIATDKFLEIWMNVPFDLFIAFLFFVTSQSISWSSYCLVTPARFAAQWDRGWGRGAPCGPEWNPSCFKVAISASEVRQWQAAGALPSQHCSTPQLSSTLLPGWPSTAAGIPLHPSHLASALALNFNSWAGNFDTPRFFSSLFVCNK